MAQSFLLQTFIESTKKKSIEGSEKYNQVADVAPKAHQARVL